MRRILILGFALLAACGSRGFRVQVGQPRPVATPGTRPTQPQRNNGPAPTNLRASGSPSDMLAQLDQLMRYSGWNPLGPVVHNPTLPTNGNTAFGIPTNASQCYAVFAIADDARADLNLWVTNPEMRTVASDMRTDAHPWGVFCPPYNASHAVRLNMRSGSSPFHFVAYVGPRSAPPDIATFYSGALAPTNAQAAMDAAAQARLSAREQNLASQGYRRTGDPIPSTLAERSERTFPLQLQSGYCYAFFSVGNAGVNDSDLFLTDGSGARIAEDHANAADAYVEHCANGTEQAQLRMRVYRGSGAVFLSAFARPNTQAQTQTQPTTPDAPSTPLSSTTSVESHALDERFALADSEMRARGYEPYNDRNDTEVPENAARETRIQLEGGKCYAVIAVGDDDIDNLDLSIRNGTTPLDADTEPNARPVVRVCPESTGTYTLRVIAPHGTGNIAVQAYKWPRGTRGPFGLRGVMYLRLAEMMTLLAGEGYEADVDYTPERVTLRDANATNAHVLALSGGQCYVVLAVGGDGVSNLGLSLTQGSTNVGTDRTNNPLPMVYRCATTDEQITATVTAEAGRGDYFMQLFKRTQH